ncbi:MAG: VanZ family protein [Nitrospirae bacterium]|nr:VanZ family protein [Nitrospirota bacterium]
MKNFIKYWLPLVVLAVLIYIGSAVSKLPPVPVKIPHLDKAVHLVEYALLSFLLRRALSQGRANRMRRASLWAVIWAILYGIINELHQSVIPNRSMSVYDAIFNGIGAILGQYLYFLYLKGIMPERNSSHNPLQIERDKVRNSKDIK